MLDTLLDSLSPALGLALAILWIALIAFCVIAALRQRRQNARLMLALSNTPQAKDDSFNLVEDYNAIAWLDVMSNDLGGNSKILWSLDDSATDAAGATDLIASDIGKVEATTNDTSANGAKIWICDGKVWGSWGGKPPAPGVSASGWSARPPSQADPQRCT
mgnify:CR=1 FL=1